MFPVTILHTATAEYDRRADIALTALTTAGYEVIGPLPEEMTDRSNVAESIRNQPMWQEGGAWATVDEEGGIDIEAAGQCIAYVGLSPSEARTIAAVLLAAARRAEETNGER